MSTDLTMCCLCFEMKTRDDLWVDEDGAIWDMCKPCQEVDMALATRVAETMLTGQEA